MCRLPLASQKMVNLTFVVDIKVLNFSSLGEQERMPKLEHPGTVRKWICNQPESFFIDGLKKWIKRLNKCVAVSGNYVEN
ncbi:hypothetical protein TNCV_3046251 [Trichonephila clavipes]|uniref:Uncharacterized protein n=1 Tax=Trichonephila clavipes TaxID=2585209 RepID=A0A8X6V0T8_TRICX|nr:hypothetical protein TNCV_3046251 [Trichonephila clavipes]